MRTLSIGRSQAHVSNGCGGLWIPGFQLKKSEDLASENRTQLIELSRQYRVAGIDTTARLRCPVDSEIVLMRRFFSFKKEVEIDECAGCGGVWLDPGEFEKILEFYFSPEALAEKEKMEQAREKVRQLNEERKRLQEKDRQDAAWSAQSDMDAYILGLATGIMF